MWNEDAAPARRLLKIVAAAAAARGLRAGRGSCARGSRRHALRHAASHAAWTPAAARASLQRLCEAASHPPAAGTGLCALPQDLLALHVRLDHTVVSDSVDDQSGSKFRKADEDEEIAGDEGPSGNDQAIVCAGRTRTTELDSKFNSQA